MSKKSSFFDTLPDDIAGISDRIDRRMTEALSSSSPSLRHAVESLRRHPGKRLRPILLGIVASAFGEVTDRVIDGGAFIEMIHVATLVHDDVIDRSEERRGARSLHMLYGNRRAVLMGDFILSRAIQLAVEADEPLVLRILGRVGDALTEGELMQDDASQLLEMSEERYFAIIERKTASLLSASALLGAVLAGQKGDRLLALLGEATRKLGTAFQIRDDIFDYLPTPGLGKPAGNDLREHKVTLPLLFALRREGRKTDRARKLLLRPDLADADAAWLTDFALQGGGIAYAEEVMGRLVEEAKALYSEAIPEGRSLALLHRLADYIVERER